MDPLFRIQNMTNPSRDPWTRPASHPGHDPNAPAGGDRAPEDSHRIDRSLARSVPVGAVPFTGRRFGAGEPTSCLSSSRNGPAGPIVRVANGDKLVLEGRRPASLASSFGSWCSSHAGVGSRAFPTAARRAVTTCGSCELVYHSSSSSAGVMPCGAT